MTSEQTKLVSAFARDLVGAMRRVLGLAGPAQPGWYRPGELTAAQRENVRRAAMPLIVRFAQQAKP
jgi:hypothetical protein